MNGLKTLEEIKTIRRKLKKENRTVVFTNGCFDLIHAGHVDYLSKARALGDVLIVGLNSDSSVKRIKGDKRPILLENERAFIISNLKPVDYVTVFDEDTPAELIQELIPDILVKGADWSIDKIIGKDIVEANGGEVKTIEFINNQSTTKIIKSILDKYKD
jgi:D-glycero-beta-D-manno-heptose 1-phosphate adenylyltransferase